MITSTEDLVPTRKKRQGIQIVYRFFSALSGWTGLRNTEMIDTAHSMFSRNDIMNVAPITT